jgi:uncharacterized protein
MKKLAAINPERLCQLKQFAFRLMDDENGKMLIDEYQTYIQEINAPEALDIFEYLLAQDVDAEKAKNTIGKLYNVFYKPLNAYQWDKPESGNFLYYLMQENREVEKIVDNIKLLIKELNEDSTNEAQVIPQLRELLWQLSVYKVHFRKIERLLLPELDQIIDQHRYLNFLEILHNEYDQTLSTIEEQLESNNIHDEALIGDIGKLFFLLFPLIFKEDQILYPIAYSRIDEKKWPELLRLSLEIGWCYNIKPEIAHIPVS